MAETTPNSEEKRPDADPQSSPSATDAAVNSPTSSTSRHLGRWRALSRRGKTMVAIVASLILIIVVIGVTPLRYPVVGLVHHGHLTVTVVDDSTNQPILGAQVTVGSHEALTDKYGQASLSGLPLGHPAVSITKSNYRTAVLHPTIFLSTAQLGKVAIHSTGVVIKFSVTDWVSNKAIKDVSVTIGKTTAVTDTSGRTSLSIAPNELKGAQATIKSGGFNTATVAVSSAIGRVNQATLVPSGNVYFLSNRSGRIDLYSSLLDGSGQTVVLKGTGNEDTQTGLLPSVSNPDVMAIVSSRAGKHLSGGNLEHDLYLFNGATDALKLVDTDVNFNDFRGWIGSSLVYFKGDDAGDSLIKAVDSQSGSVRTLVSLTSSGQPNDFSFATGLGIAGTNLYYDEGSSDSSQSGLYYIGLSGSPHQITSLGVNEAYRNTKDGLDISLSDGSWKKLTFSSESLSSLPGQPADQNDRGYADSPDGTHSAFIETRDGRAELYITDSSGGNEQAVTTSGNVNQFVDWYNSQYVVFSTNVNGNSIYIVSIGGGPEKKIADFFQGNGATYGGGYNPSYFSQ